ncbi:MULTISPECIES: OmpA family protein [unclassified Massilia]|uniref:OmpA family protein n=1 Tax=unclassified Massilia TaxID=2609279 RepID=UPI001E48426E|nr:MULTISPECIES: OmpA family protein [unclassified Massilia]
MPAADTVKGGKDHPLLSRFEGARMIGYEATEFEEVTLPAGKRYFTKERKPAFEKTLQLSGRYTRIAYLNPRERSSLEVMRNYQSALEKAGLKIVFACAKEACGERINDYWHDKRLGNGYLKEVGAAGTFIHASEQRYMAAAGTRPDGTAVNVAVWVTGPVLSYNGGAYVEIVEGKAMENGKVAANLNAAEMAKGIADEGKVAIYGVYFDTGKAEVKPDSAPALGEMAKMLQQDPKLKVYIVGHTDNQGDANMNLALSQKRAEAVVKALADGYKIEPRRLSAKGAASYAPVASNRSDAGRQKNRRVELVEM